MISGRRSSRPVVEDFEAIVLADAGAGGMCRRPREREPEQDRHDRDRPHHPSGTGASGPGGSARDARSLLARGLELGCRLCFVASYATQRR